MAINPANGENIPIFISDYALANSRHRCDYGCSLGNNDTRDWEFAQKFGLPIVQVVADKTGAEVGFGARLLLPILKPA